MGRHKDEEVLASNLKAMELIPKEGGITQAITKVRGRPRNNSNVAELDLPPVEKFKRILEVAGVTETYVAGCLQKMFEAKKQTVDRNGAIHETDDHQTRMKAIELWLKYYAPIKKEGEKHVHFHGDKQVDDLLDKARRDQG
jgi:hypothetical protein